MNSEFSFNTDCQTMAGKNKIKPKTKENSFPYYLPMNAEWKKDGFMLFQSESKPSFCIWTPVANSISYNDSLC